MANEIINNDESFSALYRQVKQIIEINRNNAYKSVNFYMVKAYWEIGKIIVENEQKGEVRAEYGKKNY